MIVLIWWAGTGWLRAASAPNPDFLIRHWLAGDGIPENTAYSVAQTPDGYLWVGTTDGLLRFNGKNFEPADQLLGQPFLGQQVDRLVVDEQGRLWAAGESGILLEDRNHWRKVEPASADLRSVTVTADGQTFVGGTSGQIYRFDENRLQPMDPPPGLLPSGVFCARDQADGGLWVANRGFIGRWTKQRWQRSELETNNLSSLVAVAAPKGGLWVYGDGRLRLYRAGSPAVDFPAPKVDEPRQILVDRQGRLWIASNTSGLACLATNGAVQWLTATNGLTHNSIWTLSEDREGNLWVGSSTGGLQRIRDRFFHTISVDGGLSDGIARTVTTDGPGTILVGTHGAGTMQIKDGRVVWAQTLDRLAPTRYVWSVLRDREQRVWLGTFQNGLFVEKKGRQRKFPLPSPMEAAVFALMEDSTGRVWVGTYAGAGVIANGRFTVPAPRLNKEHVRCFAAEPHSGAIWLGTLYGGLYRLQGTNLTHWGTAEGLPGNRICSLTFDDQDNLWVGVYKKGLVCFRAGNMICLGAEQGLPSLTLVAMLADDQGCFWFGSDRGLLRVAQADLRRVAARAQTQAKFEIFNEGDGLENAECGEGYQPVATRDASGELWFATLNGVVHVDPRRVRINPLPPLVKIERVIFRDHAGTPRQLFEPADGVILPAGSTEIAVSCAVLSFAAPEKVQLAFLLEGANNTWVNQGDERMISLRTLSYGKYTLQVKAANNDGFWSGPGHPLAIRAEPFVWQTWWFRLLLALVLLGSGGAAVWQIERGKARQQQALLARERALAHEKARLASILESTSDFVGFAAPDTGLLYLNPAGRRLVGVGEKEDVTRLGLQSFFPAAEAERLLQSAIPQAVQSGTWSGQTVLQKRTGGNVPVSQVIVAHKDAASGLLFLSTIMRDESERQRHMDELQRREEYFRSLIEHASESITVIDAQAVVTYQSTSGVRLLGYPTEAMMGRCLLDMAHPEDLLKSRAVLGQSLAHPNVPIVLTARWRHRNGSWRSIETVSTSMVSDSGEHRIVLNSRDVTDRLHLEEELRQSQKMEAIGQLAGGVAHDFNNILAALLMQVDLINLIDELPGEARKGLRQISADTHRAADLTRRLLLFSRRQVMQTRVLDLNAVIAGLADLLQRTIREDVLLQLDLHEGPLLTRADAGMLEQALLNLAVNARDAMPHGGRLRITTGETVVDESQAGLNPEAAAGRYVCFSVSDTGAGIPPEILPRIFEPFFTTKEVGKGTGLGLASVFGAVKQHQGWIKVDNRSGEGVTFHVFLPASTAAAVESSPAEPAAMPGRGTETILLVEDEMEVRKLTHMFLQRNGYRVLDAFNGVEALKCWAEHRKTVDLLLTDLVMPGGLDGQELARRLRQERPELRVIYFSGYSANTAGQNIRIGDHEDFVQKPFAPAHLLKVVRDLLDG